MTEIRWKNGGPLFLQPAPGSEFGLVATDQDCCCPPPPPERCWCGSHCSYFIELVAPSAIAVRSRVVDCGNLNDNPSSVQAEDSLLQGIVPVLQGDNGDFAFPRYYTAATALNKHFPQSLSVTVREEIAGFPTFLPPELYYFQLFALRQAFITIYCVTEEEPKFYASLLVSAAASYGFESLGFTPLGTWARLYRGTFEIPASCVVSPRRECFPASQEFLRITTPLEITLSGDGTSSLGNLSMDADGGPNSTGLPPEFPYARDAVDAILDATNYTFRITSRPKCDSPVGCNCNAPLGGMYVTFGNLKSKYNGVPRVFTIDSSTLDSQRDSVYLVQWQGPFGFYRYEEYDEDGPQDGNGNFTQAMWRQQAELYCDIVDGVSQWYVLFTSVCYKYDGGGTYTHQSYDEWVGKLDCYKACEDLGNYIDADESVPIGEPYDIEYIGRTTVTGYLECEPPPRATISLSQIVTC